MDNAAEWARFGILGLFCCAMLGSQLWLVRHVATVAWPQMLATFVAQLNFERTARQEQYMTLVTRLDALKELILTFKEKQ